MHPGAEVTSEQTIPDPMEPILKFIPSAKVAINIIFEACEEKLIL